ncbi:MAG TPA: amino acid ABC transporter permease [Acidimicrobiales bacterium]|nr:amino acid ABC transporter permease [Acidimicrobiales bacterium]
MSVNPDVDASDETPYLFSSKRSRLLVGRRGVVASTLSSLVIVGVIVAVLFVAPGGASFRYYFFNPHYLWVSWVGDPKLGIEAIRSGLLTNIWMFLVSEVLVLFIGLALAWTRMSHSPVLLPFRILVTGYTDVFRGIPLLLVVFIVGYGLPALQLGFVSSLSLATYGVIALTLTYSAYVAEVFRAGILSVPNGQLLAARSLGLTHASTMRRVTLPQAVRTVVPPLLNDFISLQKDTALVSTLGAVEATRAAQIFASTDFNGSGLVVASLFFLALTIPMTRFTDRLMARDRARRLAVAS